MSPALDRVFLDFSARKLEQLAGRIETCLAKLSEDQVWARGSASENAVGNLVLHLCGNVRQWIISGVGGQPDIRDRDAEFVARGGAAAPDLIERMRAVVAEAAETIRGVTPERLAARVSVQKYDLTVLEAICHVVEHFSMHAGQIIFATKMLTHEDLGFYAHLTGKTAHGEKTP